MSSPLSDPPAGFVALANGKAGSVDERTLADAVAELAHHAPTEVRRTNDPGDVDDALSSLDGRRPVVVGGDGSLHLVVNRLLDLGLGSTPLGLVPLGTGNDLARGAGLPLDAVEAARVAAAGVVRAVSVARHPDGEAVVNNAHLGLGAVAALKADGLKRWLGPIAYPAGSLAAGVRPDVLDVEVSIDGHVQFDGRALAVLVALGPSAGGGHELAVDAEPTDARLDVVVVADGPARDRLGLALDVLRRRDPADRRGVESFTGGTVDVTSRGDSATAHAWDVDGEPRQWDGTVALAIDDTPWHLVVGSAGPGVS